MKRCYLVSDIGDEEGYCIRVVASSTRDAKKIAGYSVLFETGGEWTDLRATWNRNAKIDDLEIGHTFETSSELRDALKREVYSFVDGIQCPVCKIDSYLELHPDGQVMCNDCWDNQKQFTEVKK